jgi:tetratricopeptide (TPR) repeat protein
VVEAPITRTCDCFAAPLSLALGLVLAATAQPAAAIPLATYVEARAAQMEGDEVRSAQLFAEMAQADPADKTIARRAIATAIQSGQPELALTLARKLSPNELPIDARLLLAGDSLRRGKAKDAIELLEKGVTSTEVELFAPLVRAWELTRKGKADGAASLAALPANSPLKPIADEQRAAMLLQIGKVDEALPVAQSVVERAGGRGTRLRLAYADALARQKRTDAAHAMLEGSDETLAMARGRLKAGKAIGMAISTPAEGYAEMLVALAVDLSRDDKRALPISLTQVARHTNPGNSEATILLSLLLEGDGRLDDALALLSDIAPDDLLAEEALDVRTRLLGDRGRYDEALKLAWSAAQDGNAGAQDYTRLGNVFGDMDRHAEAASAYGEALARAGSGSNDPIWTLHLLRAASLEQANRWGDAKTELEAAMKLEPDNPLLLNFLGYGKLERGEDLDRAEAMIRRASALRPDDASITDSLGWALYKRGRLPEAIETLTRAAAGDPTQAEIHEHLGDALYSGGRRIEARFSWRAALLNAEDKAKTRIQNKIDSGLTLATAAP